jgi:2-oxoglutarate dehydrogenase E1 component
VVHGDAAFAGQGVVQEMLNLSRLDGYQTGGTVHVILNNQIGFTTQPWQSRSTQYPSDVARMLQVPVFHVNGEQPEAVDRVIGLALDFRKKWGRDVVVDMYCYRRRGHMELDDPSCTQPLLYQAIEQRPPIRESYTANLLRLGNVSVEEADAIASESRLVLEQALANAAGTTESDPQPVPELPPAELPDILTAVSRERLTASLNHLGVIPDGFTPHPKIAALARRRQSMARSGKRIDWATGETLAYATLLGDGHSVRISGQDSERGTFAHRHAVLHDAKTGARHIPLAAIGEQHDSRFSVQNSPLTETAVMAFEFGYSIEARDDLVIWEAQFGDFANVAQVIIDQFVVSSQAKWFQPSGLVLFLPHGLEGQGPEHSSARPERFLQLCADGNIDVAYLSTASQVFHRLRHQVLSVDRRPLIAFTPKSMLQKPAAASPMDAFCNGAFQPVIADDKTSDPARVVLCAGQLGTEIQAEREKRNSPVAVIRLEQLYPFPTDKLAAAVAKYPSDVPVVWVQEEPENMGAWHWLRPRLEAVVGNKPIDFVARPERASPATGSLAIHRREQRAILARALDVSPARTRRVPGSDGACLVTKENESGGG